MGRDVWFFRNARYALLDELEMMEVTERMVIDVPELHSALLARRHNVQAGLKWIDEQIKALREE